jgi:hypothetical protein
VHKEIEKGEDDAKVKIDLRSRNVNLVEEAKDEENDKRIRLVLQILNLNFMKNKKNEIQTIEKQEIIHEEEYII